MTARRRTWSDTKVADLPRKDKRYAVPDPEFPGLWVRITPSGAKSYVAVALHKTAVNKSGKKKQVWHTIGSTMHYSLAEARTRAADHIKAIKDGKDSSGPMTFETVADAWLKSHVDAKGLRSKDQIVRHLDRMKRAWGGRDFAQIRRIDVAMLQDEIADTCGPRSSDYMLSTFSSLASWYARRHENYSSPIVKGMKRQSAKETARDRILDDNELRKLWAATETAGTFGALVRLLLLSSQRLDKVRNMAWSDLDQDAQGRATGVWRIPSEDREKGNAGELMLPALALDVINNLPRFASNDHVFVGRADKPITTWHQKETLDAALAFETKWTLHDLRRSARSLMSRAGVLPHVAEQVLGHSLRGIVAVYDRYRYVQEKADALARLAHLIETIVIPPQPNVIQLNRA